MPDDAAIECARLAARIREALARGEGELGIDVAVDGAEVTLRGVVQSDERRWRIELLSREVSHGLAIQNEITVCPPGTPVAPESLP
jgi:BON domain-containing protein